MASATDIGTFDVTADPSEVAAFRAATGLGEGAGVPLTFPIRWLASPAVKAALGELVPEPDLVLIHESQSFDYGRPLRENERYSLGITAHRMSDPDRLVAKTSVNDAEGALCATLETVLRLFSTTAVAA